MNSVAEELRAASVSDIEARSKWRKLGSLEAGKFADLVILDKDYMTIPIDQFHTMHPVLTMVGGKTVYRKEGN